MSDRVAPTPAARLLTRRLTRHSLLNVAGTVLPLVVALLVVPILPRELGAAGFGLLGLAWALLEYASLLDLGLGRATTRAVAEAITRRDPDLPDIVVLSTAMQGALGVLVGALVYHAASPLAASIADLTPELRRQAEEGARILAVGIPFVLVGLALRGVIEATGRFGVSNAIRAVSGSVTFGLPAFVVTSGGDLPLVFALLVLMRIVTCVVLAVAVALVLPDAEWRLPRATARATELLRFGGWVAVSNLVLPLFLYFDRFALGTVSAAAVGYYTGPFEIALRFLIVPGAIALSLFQIVSAMSEEERATSAGALHATALRRLLLVMGPACLLLVLLAPTLLELWLGADFAREGSTALRILAVGVLLNAVAHVPSATLLGLGRPDLTAKVAVAEALVHVPLTLWLVRGWGIEGAALAWSLRTTLDALILLLLAPRVMRRAALRPSP